MTAEASTPAKVREWLLNLAKGQVVPPPCK
jgi:hypothetical protein